MKHIYSILTTLVMCHSLVAGDKTLAQQLEQARAEQQRLDGLADESQRQIKALHNDIRHEQESQAHDKVGRAQIRQAHTSADNTRKANDELRQKIQIERDKTAQYAVDQRALQRSIEREDAQGKTLQHDLERERRKKEHHKQQLEAALHEIETLQGDITHERQALADLQVHTKKDYGAPALLQEQHRLRTQISNTNKENAAVTEHIQATQLNTKELEATNAALEYTNQKLKERLLAKLQGQPIAPVAEVIKIFKNTHYKLGDEDGILAQHPGKEKEYRALAHAYLVFEQEYAASLNAARAIENEKKGFAEKHTYKIAGGIPVVCIIAGFCLRLFSRN